MNTTIKILLVALAYTLAGKAGLKLAFVNASATAVWPPAGIALAALLLWGMRLWPAIFLGAFIVNLSTAGTIFTSLGIATGNTLEALLAVAFVNRFAGGLRTFDRPYDVFKYTVLAAMGSPLVAATIGVTTLTLGGFADRADFATVWLTWWLGDAGGIFLIAPVLVLWIKNAHLSWQPKKIAEAGLVTLSLGILGWLVFGGLISSKTYPLEFLCTPVVIWAAFRLGQRGAATMAFFLSAMAIWGTLHGIGPFAEASLNNSLLFLQGYLGVLSVMSLAVAAIVAERGLAHDHLEEQVQKRTDYLRESLHSLQEQIDERERAEGALKASEARFHRLMESTVIGIIVIDGEGRIGEANDTFLKLVGYSGEDLRQGALNARALTPPEYESQEGWALEQLRDRGIYPALEKELIHRQGNRIPVLIGGVRLDQFPPRSLCFVIDVTHRRQAMEALSKAYDEIELRVEERTKELSLVNAELAREITRRQKAETELRNLSLQDPLTGLYNRRGFMALAEQQWLQALRDKRTFLLFYADVDGLKQINDTLGHARGDQAIEKAAEVLRHAFRKSDIIARIGGDEFAIVATQVPLDHTDAYLNRLQTQLAELNKAGRLPFNFSLSIGSAVFDYKETTSVQELMRRADEDLYAHKRHHSSPTPPQR